MQCSTFLSTPSARRATDAATLTLRARVAFLSTPSARRATGRDLSGRQQLGYFYPRPPRGGRRRGFLHQRCRTQISIHALREEGDPLPQIFCSHSLLFLSTPSARRATHRAAAGRLGQVISIHALREEGDRRPKGCRSDAGYFYPRPPRGGRPSRKPPLFLYLNFYPRPPRGGRRPRLFRSLAISTFLSTPSARRATRRPSWRKKGGQNFYPRPPRGGRPGDHRTGRPPTHFYPRPPRGGRQ